MEEEEPLLRQLCRARQRCTAIQLLILDCVYAHMSIMHRESHPDSRRHPCAAKYVRQAGAQDGATLRLAEAGKRSRYPAVAAAGLDAVVPFAVETFGRLGPNAVHLLRTARQQAAEQQAPYARWPEMARDPQLLASAGPV